MVTLLFLSFSSDRYVRRDVYSFCSAVTSATQTRHSRISRCHVSLCTMYTRTEAINTNLQLLFFSLVEMGYFRSHLVDFDLQIVSSRSLSLEGLSSEHRNTGGSSHYIGQERALRIRAFAPFRPCR